MTQNKNQNKKAEQDVKEECQKIEALVKTKKVINKGLNKLDVNSNLSTSDRRMFALLDRLFPDFIRTD